MEGKKSVCCLLIMIVLVCGQQQQQQAAAAMTTFCGCYKDCYNKCRGDSRSKSLCGFVCFTTCPLTPQPPARDCAGFCRSLAICGTAAIGPAGMKACVDHCANNLGGAHAPSAAALS